jgi:hypothetical protein
VGAPKAPYLRALNPAGQAVYGAFIRHGAALFLCGRLRRPLLYLGALWLEAGNFDLLAPRLEVEVQTKMRVFEALKERQYESVDSLANRLSLDRATVLGSLGAYTQAGRAIYDIDKQVYRVRELSREPLPFEKLRFANEREQEASVLLSRKGAVKVGSSELDKNGTLRLKGSVSTNTGKLLYPMLIIDADQRIIDGGCTCNWYQGNKLQQGPCAHMIALRLQSRSNAVRRV